MRKWFSIAFFLILLLIASYAFISNFEFPFRIQENVREICQIENKMNCDPECVDGFSETCYFDVSQKDRISLGDEYFLTDDLREICLGIHSKAVCGKCFNIFEIRKGEGLTKVSCEYFFQSIQNKNISCKGCIDSIKVGCC